MKKVIGYMVTFTTYGTWLQGDERGYVKDGTVLNGNEALHYANRRAIGGQRVKLGARDKEIVKQAILNEAQQMKQKVFTILVWSSHVHVVVENINEPVGKVVGRYKAAATKELRRIGFEGKVWSKGYDKRFCFSEEELSAKVDYVNKHEEFLSRGRAKGEILKRKDK
jgi:hypothetical protein